MGIWVDFQGLTEATGGGRGSKNAKIEATSFMDAPFGYFSNMKAIVEFHGEVGEYRKMFASI